MLRRNVVPWLGRLLRFPWVRSSPAPRATLVCWIVLAIISVGSVWAGCLKFGGAVDYWWVRRWLDAWQFGAHNPYHIANLQLDYPPWALLLLTPLSWFPDPAPQFDYLIVNSVIGAVAAWQLVQWVSEMAGVKPSRMESVALSAMLLSTRPLRYGLLLGQTMPVVVLLFVVAMRLAARRRPWLSGVCFALASFKLNLAVAFGLVLLVFGDWLALAAGLMLTFGLFLASAALFREAPWTLAADYARSLERIYGGPHFTTGVTGVKSLFAAMTSDYAAVQVAYVLFVLVSLAVIVFAVRMARRHRVNAAVIGSLVFLWAMLILPNQRYNLPLVLPILWLTHWPETSLVRTPWLRWTLSTVGLAFFLASIPFEIEDRLVPWWFTANAALGGALDAVWPHRARLMVLALFSLLLIEIWRCGRQATRPVVERV